jgi:hypothetical protein
MWSRDSELKELTLPVREASAATTYASAVSFPNAKSE